MKTDDSMISNKNWMILFAVSLCLTSLLLFIFHFMIFHDLHHILIYTVHDLAFLPIEVLLVTLILHQMLERRAMRTKFEKLNMVIGVFFSEIGIPLLRFFVSHDPDMKEKYAFFSSIGSWDHAAYMKKIKETARFSYDIRVSCADLRELRSILVEKENLLVRMLENPVLLEHESFTEVLQAVFHLTEELKYRGSCENLPESDIGHLSGDIKRGYSHMVTIWLSYLDYLKANYPYLHSLSVRTNPFSGEEQVIIRE